MKRPVVWLPEAVAELKEAWEWYEKVRPHLGDRLEQAVTATVDAITNNPLQFPAVHRERRRAGVRHFPYGLFFEIQQDRIVIIACFHARRDPKRWQSR